MAELVFEDLEFEQKEDKIIVRFLDNFYFEVDKKSLGQITISKHKIDFKGLTKEKATDFFNKTLDRGFENLISSTTHKKTIYINKYSGLPLIGSGAFGIVDRNSNMLEIKPVTGCNMNCNFCSVDEGLTSKKVSEIVIDKDYLVQEAKKVIETKACDVHITINAHGEPTLYKPMPELIADLIKIKNVKTVSLITNGTLLSEEYIDRLAASNLTTLNVSLNAVSEKMGKILEGHGKYDVEHVKRMATYAAKKLGVVLAPVFVPGYNDNELGEIIKFAKRIGAKVGIQNYLYYRYGRNPDVKQMSWDNFYKMLRKLEKQHDFKLVLGEKDFGIIKTPPLPKPFKKGQVIEAIIKCPGRYNNELVAAADNRNITLVNSNNNRNKKVKVKITSDKHNIFYGTVV